MPAISHQSLAAAGCKPSSEYRSKPPVSLAAWAQCPLDVWIAASLSHHSCATLGVLHCDSREAQQAYGGSGVWQKSPYDLWVGSCANTGVCFMGGRAD